MNFDKKILDFLSAQAFGVVGASRDRSKYGNKVLRCYLQNDRHVIPVNLSGGEIEGLQAVTTVNDLPDVVSSLSIITPPDVTEQVVDCAIDQGIKNVWMQPGAESPRAVEKCRKAGLNVIADGSCVLVVLGYKEH